MILNSAPERRSVRQEDLDGAAPTPPKSGIPLKGEVLTGSAFDKWRYYGCSITDINVIANTIINNTEYLMFNSPKNAHRTRKDNSVANLGLICRTVLNLLQQDTETKISIRHRKR